MSLEGRIAKLENLGRGGFCPHLPTRLTYSEPLCPDAEEPAPEGTCNCGRPQLRVHVQYVDTDIDGRPK